MEAFMRQFIYLSLAYVCLTVHLFGQSSLDIELKNNSRGEQQTRDQLQRLMREYDLTPFIFTRPILIDEKAIPHSHPVLTLHTRHLKQDEQLLSTFIHEQAHWWTSSRDNFAAMNPDVGIGPVRLQGKGGFDQVGVTVGHGLQVVA
jgi:hypothetical protein